MARRDLRLDCTRCDEFTHYDVRRDDPKDVVRCETCGKKHSTDSIDFVKV